MSNFKNSKPLISIIIRTKNEERWIKICLNRIFEQTYKKFELIIVDNFSTDNTLQKIKSYKISKIIKIKKFLPGKAINMGAKIAEGKYLIILSAHCIPTNNFWLENYIKLISSYEKKVKNIAGIYGRQEPMISTPSNDRRDLHLLFGLDTKIQKKDSFFHNANSLVVRSVWEKFNFDEKIKNIEDRLWAEKVLKNNLKIIYDPKPSVYHYHGIHQNNNEARLQNVVKIIEKKMNYKSGKINPLDLNIVAIIPISGVSKKIDNKFLIEFTINYLKKSKFINKIIVSTDNLKTKKIVNSFDIDVPFIRPKKFSLPKVNLEEVHKFTLSKIEKNNYFPDLIVHVEETFPFREKDLIDNMILKILHEGLDSVVASKREYHWLWRDNNNDNFERVDSGDVRRRFKEKSVSAFPGIGCVTYPEFIRNKSLLGKNIGLYDVNNQLSFIEIREKDSFDLVNRLQSILEK